MILNQVHLHNFMSYADATLDLTGIPVVCLTGLNGAGKSALLDAVTWAFLKKPEPPQTTWYVWVNVRCGWM
ncbi:MAG: AAA family ATPase [Candidatus Obscuribacter sp.]|nr:AAA family ATPase [Candidatus Obscuribacter sp.]